MKKTHSPHIQNLIKELSEDKMPKITIVTATYNLIKAGRKEFFKKCIESIYSQTYKNFEHIIIDGASDDGTLDLIKEIAPRSTVISEPDKGIYDAFNKGVKKASGEYVHFLNSDDYYTDKKSLEISAKYLSATDADFSCSDCYFVDENDKITNVFYAEPEVFFYYIPFCHQSMIVKKEALVKAGFFDTKYKIAADYNLIIDLILNGASFVKIPGSITNFRNCGVSSNTINTDIENEEIIRKYFKKEVSSIKNLVNAKHIFLVPKALIESIMNSRADITIKQEIARLAERGTNFGKYILFKKHFSYEKSIKKLKFMLIPFRIKTCRYPRNLGAVEKIFKIEYTNDKTVYRLFGIPFVSVRNNQSEFALYLFNIPVIKYY